jgi:hypothetical protein
MAIRKKRPRKRQIAGFKSCDWVGLLGGTKGVIEEEIMMTGIGYLRRLGQGLRSMKHPTLMKLQEGKMGYILLWLVGVPIPILLVIFLLRGCD